MQGHEIDIKNIYEADIIPESRTSPVLCHTTEKQSSVDLFLNIPIRSPETTGFL